MSPPKVETLGTFINRLKLEKRMSPSKSGYMVMTDPEWDRLSKSIAALLEQVEACDYEGCREAKDLLSRLDRGDV